MHSKGKGNERAPCGKLRLSRHILFDEETLASLNLRLVFILSEDARKTRKKAAQSEVG